MRRLAVIVTLSWPTLVPSLSMLGLVAKMFAFFCCMHGEEAYCYSSVVAVSWRRGVVRLLAPFACVCVLLGTILRCCQLRRQDFIT